MKNRHVILFFKLAFIISCFVFILWKADTAKIWYYIKTINPSYLLLSYFLITLAQIISAFRMRFYYLKENMQLNRRFSIGIYFTSMLFNTVLPGGIGGDAYKILTISNLAGFSRIRAFKLAISERASGLFPLLILTAIFYIFTDFSNIIPYQNFIILGLTILLIPSYFISIRILLKETIKTAIGATLYSFPIQLLNVAVIVILLIALKFNMHNVADVMGYLVIFMVSSVASILPITIGGAGVRELTFLYGSQLIGLDAEIGITLAFLFFIMNVMCSLNGLLFWHRLEKL